MNSWRLPYGAPNADVAQSVEQLIRNEQVTGSSPVVGSSFKFSHRENLSHGLKKIQ